VLVVVLVLVLHNVLVPVLVLVLVLVLVPVLCANRSSGLVVEGYTREVVTGSPHKTTGRPRAIRIESRRISSKSPPASHIEKPRRPADWMYLPLAAVSVNNKTIRITGRTVSVVNRLTKGSGIIVFDPDL
jgi:hypothetical protein